MRPQLALLVGTMPLLLACAAGDGSSGYGNNARISKRDSAGVEIVEVPGELLDSLPLWRTAAQPSLSIGEVAGEAPYNFQMISTARRLQSGEIMVTDLALDLRIFGPDGVYRRTYGGRGPGPGEFGGYPIVVSESDGDRVAIYDRARGVYTNIDLRTGDFSVAPVSPDCVPAANAERSGTCNIARIFADGAMVVSRPDLSTATPAPFDRENPQRIRISRSGDLHYGLLQNGVFQPLDTVGGSGSVQSGVGSDYFGTNELFNPGGQVAFGVNALVVGDPKTFELRLHGSDGRLRRIIRILEPAIPVTDAVLGVHRRFVDSVGRNAAMREYVNTLRPEGIVPFFDAIRLDRAGRIWIRDYAPAFWGPSTAGRWTILHADGSPAGRFLPDRRITILEAGDNYLLMRETDADGVEFVRLYDWLF
jgi:hypothetical protein